jgi:hypothetical protein
MPPQPPSYDVFLCHNSPEEAAVSWLDARLRGEGLRASLDRRRSARLQSVDWCSAAT